MPAIDLHPALTVRSDGKSIVVFEERVITPPSSAIVLVIDEAVPFGSYNWHYTYDDLGRMTSACPNWQTGECLGNVWQYSHDGAGNLLLFEHWDAEHRETVTAQYVINGANQIECVDDASGDGECNDGETLWDYDPYGNLLWDGITVYSYDAAGRLSTVTIDAATTTRYTYNGDGERIAQTHVARTTTYLLDVAASSVLAETTDGQTTHYLNGLTPIAQSNSTATSYYQYDGAGTARQMTDTSGTVLSAQTFDPYGNPYPTLPTGSATYGFGGGSQDTNGLLYAQGQYYSTSMGRFVQHQINMLGRNLSQYQTFREVSQAAYNMQPMVAGLGQSFVYGANPLNAWRDNFAPAINAYNNEGERNLLTLYLDWDFSNRTKTMIDLANFTNQWNADSRAVFRPGYRWYDRLPAATRIGGTGVAAGDMFANAWMLIRPAVVGNRTGLFGLGGEPTYARLAKTVDGVEIFDNYTGVDWFDRKAIDTPEFARWKANLEERGWVVKEVPNLADKATTKLVNDIPGKIGMVEYSSKTAYIDMLHESRHVIQLERALAAKRAGIIGMNKDLLSPRYSAFWEYGAYSYELRLGAKFGFRASYMEDMARFMVEDGWDYGMQSRWSYSSVYGHLKDLFPMGLDL